MSEGESPEVNGTAPPIPTPGPNTRKVGNQTKAISRLEQEIEDLKQEVSGLSNQGARENLSRDAVRLWWGRALMVFGGSVAASGVVKLFLSETWEDSEPYRALSSLAIFGLAFGLIHVGQRLFVSETTHAEIERERAKSKAAPEAAPPVELVKVIADTMTSAFKTFIEIVKKDGPKG